MAATDLPALTVEVERARLAGEFRASSDVNGDDLIKSFAVDPVRVGGALGLYESEGFVRSRTRERWSRSAAAAPAR